jgi:LemA protein
VEAVVALELAADGENLINFIIRRCLSNPFLKLDFKLNLDNMAKNVSVSTQEPQKKFFLSKKMIAVIIILLIIVIPLLWIWSLYNGFVTKEVAIEGQWAQVESQYQRRADLIPNLVSTARGYMQFEQDLLTNITELRSRWQSASTQQEKIESGTAMDSAISRLLLVYENYPELKSQEVVSQLMDELSGTENRIATERMRYNDAVRDFNTAIRRFPGNVVAGWFGFEKKLFFSAEPGSENAPDVDLSI